MLNILNIQSIVKLYLQIIIIVLTPATQYLIYLDCNRPPISNKSIYIFFFMSGFIKYSDSMI